jgi:hypothetical protein
LKVLILVRRFVNFRGDADEHDFNSNNLIFENIQKINKNLFIKFDVINNFRNYVDWKPNFIIFLGFDHLNVKIQKTFAFSKSIIWAKCNNFLSEKKYDEFTSNLFLIFDSCFFKKNLKKKYKKKYFYLPTAIHVNYKNNFLNLFLNYCFGFYKKKNLKIVDLAFSGSPRFNRSDFYRQRLIKTLLERNIKILICAPKKLWLKSIFDYKTHYNKNLFFSSDNNWAGKETYSKSKFILDLPWLDTIIDDLEKKNDPQFALGWNIFRAGFHGANIITYKCKMNKTLGLNNNNVNFYKKNISNISDLANEIIAIINSYNSIRAKTKKKLIKDLFKKKHIYLERWNKIFYTIFNLEKKIYKKNKN